MGILLIIPVLISGFIYCNTRWSEYYKLHRYQGQYLYLASAKYGVYNTALVILIEYFSRRGTDINPLSLFTPLFPQIDTETAYLFIFIVNTAVLSIVTPYLFAMMFNLVDVFVLKGKITAKAIAQTKIKYITDILSDSPLDQLLIKSYLDTKPILMTLDSGKVYVGFVTQLGEPNESEGMRQEIGLKPTASGYREKETHKVTLTTSYKENSEDAYVVIRYDLITTACRFYPAVYEQTRKQ